MRHAGLLRLGFAAVLALSSPAAIAEGPRVEALAVRWDGEEALVSYRVIGGLTDAALERIHSGIPLRFRHRIELRERRSVPLWPSHELGRTTVETQVEYDSLTQEYRLRRDTRVRGSALPEPVVVEATTASRQEMEDWMTRISDARVVPTAGRGSGSVRLKVDVTLGRRWVLLVFPSTVDASATVGVAGPD